VFRRICPRLNSCRGSSVVGFALVAPLVTAVFVAVTQIVMLLGDKSTVTSAAVAGARDASAADASAIQGIAHAKKILASKKYLSDTARISLENEQNAGVHFVRMTVECDVEIPWINQAIHISSTSRSLDERSL
jgi:Flp pilus assembly protein TadG